MKGWFTIAILLLGGYVALKWYKGQSNSPAAAGATNPPGGGGTGATSPVSAVTGVGDFFLAPLASGVPAFNQASIANGHGDQVAAAYHSNALSTLNGSATYEAAFGSNTNQNGGIQVF